jgi:GDP/UDP-N,N'-diacetylbacillosamine 2-epimerase (hydrolysing)
LSKIKKDPDLTLKLVATGAHLSPEFGSTYKQIEQDGFVIDRKIDMLLSGDEPVAVNKSMGAEFFGFADYFSQNRPDLIIVLGDRYELLPVCICALIEKIPIAHISGGEVTEGAIDDCVRHAVTKLSYLHFVANEEFKKRVIQMGEDPQRVFAFGELGLENILGQELFCRQELKNKLENLGKSVPFSLEEPYALVTFHPETLTQNSQNDSINELFVALEQSGLNAILTKSNADVGGRTINAQIDRYEQKNSSKCVAFKNLGEPLYLSAMKHCALVLGNSSSGIWQAPSFCVPSVNIGDRQKGRMQAKSTINTPAQNQQITKAIQKALSPEFLQSIKNTQNPYGNGNTSKRILSTIKKFIFDSKIDLKKPFFDISLV